jgi:hypothetical protein
MMESFYVTLPNNSSTRVYPNNRAEHFKTVLPRRFDLNGDYEVALTELHYPQYLYNINKDIHYLIVYFGHDNEEGVHIIEGFDIPLKSGVYFGIEQLILHMNSLSGSGVLKYKFEMKDKFVSFRTEYVDTDLKMSDSLALMLGFMPGLVRSHEERAHTLPNLQLGLPKSIYVYMDIVHPQFVGDVMARLLRVVRVDMKKFVYGGMCTETFHNPQYVPVEKNDFQEVEIDIRDEFGNPVSFFTGSTTAVLHFRKR